MESKTFLVVWGAVFTVAILVGFFVVGSYISTQQFKQFQSQTNKTDTNFNRSLTIHDFLFDNITELKKALDPILDTIPNATQSKLDQDRHYSNAVIHFKELGVINQTIYKILEVLNKSSDSGDNGTIIPVPVPIFNNVTKPIIDDRGLNPINTTTGLSG